MGVSSEVKPAVDLASRCWLTVTSFSLPAGSVALIVLVLSMPTGFPRHLSNATRRGRWTRESFLRIDLIGTFLLFGSSVLLVATLEEAGSRYEWSSAIIIVFLVLCGAFWLCFLGWEWFVSREGSIQEPVLTWRFMENRIFMGMLLCVSNAML